MTPSQQELLSQLPQLEELISELVDIVKGNRDLEKQVRSFLSDLQERVKELELVS